MPTVSSTWLSDTFNWRLKPLPADEFLFRVRFLGKLTKRAALQKTQTRMAEDIIPWLSLDKKVWSLDFDRLRAAFPNENLDQLWRGNVHVKPDIDEVPGFYKNTSNTQVEFLITAHEVKALQSRKIFLSHKGEDKKLVRRFQRALEAIGYDVWLDEKNLKAGDQLERGILQGFKESCAAVFFITGNFKDCKYLKSEINYAIAQTREKEDYFRIITLAFQTGKEKIEIPELLKSYVWKTPRTELDALTEIIKAQPHRTEAV